MQQMASNNVQISEIFTSIEGEGILFGTKTMFIRLAGCHLKCRWCDTDYALPLNSGNNYSFDEAKRLIIKCLQHNTYKVNFTGGEPLIQYEAVIKLAKFIKQDIGIKTYIESACFDSDRFAKVLPYIDICKIEFKMSDSKVVSARYYKNLLINEVRCLQMAIDNHKVTYIKVVVTNSTEIKEIRDLVKNIFGFVGNTDIAGFVIQPSYKIDEPTIERLLEFYDVIYPFYQEVRIIPQLHKIIGAR